MREKALLKIYSAINCVEVIDDLSEKKNDFIVLYFYKYKKAKEREGERTRRQKVKSC